MNGVDHLRALTRKYSHRYFPSRTRVEIHLSGEWRVAPNTQVGTGVPCLGVWET